jgi:hypothetical protein
LEKNQQSDEKPSIWSDIFNFANNCLTLFTI